MSDDYSKYGEHAGCVREFDELRDGLMAQFPPCPECGCRTPDDADAKECGCDAGCNEAVEYPPGVTVILARAVKAERERLLSALREFLPQYVASVVVGTAYDNGPVYASGRVAFVDAVVNTFALMSTPDAELLDGAS